MWFAFRFTSPGCRCFADSAWWWRAVFDARSNAAAMCHAGLTGGRMGCAFAGTTFGNVGLPLMQRERHWGLGIGH